MCRHTPPLTTQNCTTLQPSTSTHTHTHTHTLTKTHKHLKQKPCTQHFFACGFHNLAIRELLFLFLFLSWMLFVYCIVFIVCLLCISIFIRVYLYMYCCCFRYLNGVCPVRDGHRGHHQHAPAQRESLIALDCHDDGDPATSSSSFVPELLYCFLFATKDCIRLNCGYCCQQFSTVLADV